MLVVKDVDVDSMALEILWNRGGKARAVGLLLTVVGTDRHGDLRVSYMREEGWDVGDSRQH